MGHSLVPIRITARVIWRFQNNIFRRAMINMAESLRVHSLIARAALHSHASAGCNFGQTAGPSLIKFGTREGGEGGEGREGRAGEGRGGEGTVHTFHKPEPLWPRSLAGHPLRGWPASIKYTRTSSRNISRLPFHAVLCPKPQYMSPTIVTYAQKSA